ncbi:TlpA disulfide reductase family protein [Pseudomonas anguilliseptica]|jgi:thiol-disulfide isomerase/thioredoxin|uniref:TlpA disulfide reductase family protein n=1 Tax=Pseudomonas anguilliseptica TaxID=53406 RepID=UPI001F40112A|nr:TlpA disulfide reductase family protein [Pseudomonas anguilliseptica]MCE5363156.1 TlpA family protein disulfide reductase [Pseudomonas anguilliseptica]
MGMRFQAIIRAVAGVGIGLILAGCAEDIGVDQHGRKVAVERLEGQWLVINYWAQWCAPCRTEIPELNALEKQLKAQSVQVLGVNFDGLQDEKLSQASQDMGISFTVLAQDPAERYQLPRAEVLPVTYIVDPQGRMRERLLGEQTAAGLTARLAALKAQE